MVDDDTLALPWPLWYLGACRMLSAYPNPAHQHAVAGHQHGGQLPPQVRQQLMVQATGGGGTLSMPFQQRQQQQGGEEQQRAENGADLSPLKLVRFYEHFLSNFDDNETCLRIK